jgi:hypothetical protein
MTAAKPQQQVSLIVIAKSKIVACAPDDVHMMMAIYHTRACMDTARLALCCSQHMPKNDHKCHRSLSNALLLLLPLCQWQTIVMQLEVRR